MRPAFQPTYGSNLVRADDCYLTVKNLYLHFLTYKHIWRWGGQVRRPSQDWMVGS
jgi:hypothetical protein